MRTLGRTSVEIPGITARETFRKTPGDNFGEIDLEEFHEKS